MIPHLTDPRAMLRVSWLGLWAGVIATAGGAEALAAHVARGPAVATLTPQDLTAWITAIASGIGAVAAALNGLAVVVHKLRQLQAQAPPRRRRRKKARPEGTPDAAPHPIGPDAPHPAPA